MRIWQHLKYLKRPPWRTLVVFIAIFGLTGLGYYLWSPGKTVRDGRHDLRSNGIWLQHGWLGDDLWFKRNQKDKALFRDDQRMQNLVDLLTDHGVKYLFPHLCPCNPGGAIAPVDPVQAERFLDHFANFQVIPWVGGVLDIQCFPTSPLWRANFVASVVNLLQSHPRLAGVQVNIEPMPTGNADFLLLLDEIRQAMPVGKIISVAAYPPPTLWHPVPAVHWEQKYFRQVARRVDQLAPMMYDTAIRFPKCYQHLMSSWTTDIVEWSEGTQVLFGIPVYSDAGVEYHYPNVENLHNALLGIHAGLSKLSKYTFLPTNYAGVAMYCEWEMDQQEWDYFEREFEKKEKEPEL
ncbi:MAG: hypothetical protein D3913_09900 [Candidatus Electrothrix sp. LOE1_4_5]|nr:hypothetical protein [Candidatus Electrothrix gigas]